MNKIELTPNKVLLNTTSGVLSKVLNVFLLFWLNQYLVKNMSQEEFSLYPVSMSVILFVAIIRSVFSGGLVRHLSIAYAKEDYSSMTIQVSSNFLLQMLGGIGIILFGFFFSMNADKIITVNVLYVNELKSIFLILFTSFVIRQIVVPLEMGLQLKQDFFIINLIEVISVLLRILFIIFFFIIFEISVIYVVVSNELALVITAFIRVILSRKKLPELRVDLRMAKMAEIKKFLKFSSNLLLINISHRIQESADPIILNKLSDPYNITCFYIGSLFRKQIKNFNTMFTNTFIPGLSSMHANNDDDGILRSYINYGKYYSLFYFMIVTPLVLLNKPFIHLYIGDGFGLAGKILILLSLDSLVVLGNSLFLGIALAKGEVKQLSKRILLCQVLNLIITLILNMYFQLGALGCAIGTFFTNMFVFPILVVPICLIQAKCTINVYIKRIFFPGVIPFLTIIGFVTVIHKIFQLIPQEYSWGKLILHSIYIVVFYVISCYVFSINKDEKKAIYNIIKTRIIKR